MAQINWDTNNKLDLGAIGRTGSVTSLSLNTLKSQKIDEMMETYGLSREDAVEKYNQNGDALDQQIRDRVSSVIGRSV